MPTINYEFLRFSFEVRMEKKTQWYIPNDATVTPEGPFTQEEIVIKIKNGELGPDKFIWGNHFPETRWMRIIECPEFALCLTKYPLCPIPKKRSRGLSQQTINQFDFSKKDGEYGVENEYRRFPRAPFHCDVIIHNQKQILKCRSVDISEKGLSTQSEGHNFFQLGEEVIVTLLDTPYGGTFSMHATIVRSQEKPFLGYGIYFLTVSPNLKSKIAQFVIESLGIAREEKERKTA